MTINPRESFREVFLKKDQKEKKKDEFTLGIRTHDLQDAGLMMLYHLIYQLNGALSVTEVSSTREY